MAGVNSRRLDVSEFDFDDIKENLKTFLKNQNEFRDYDFEGAGINILLDTLAYNTHYLGFNANMLANEMFLDSSSLRSSVVSHAKTLGYEVDSCRSAFADIDVSLNNTSKSTATMPAGTVFTTKINNEDYQFVTVSDATATSSGFSIKFENIKIYEGTYVTTRYTVDSSNLAQRFILPDPSSDTSTLIVEVQNSISDTTTTVFTKATDISQLAANSNVYFLQEIEAGKFEIYFGDNVVSNSVSDSNIVLLNYVVTNKKAGNGGTNFANSAGIDNVTDVTVTTINKASGGNEPETISSIKLNAPLDYASQGRCVTLDDYKLYARKLFPQTQAVMVFGGESGSYDPSLGVTTTASYGRVYISIKSTTGNNLTTAQKDLLVSNMRKFNVASITPVIIDPEIVYLILNIKFKYNSSRTTKDKSSLISSVNAAIDTYNNSTLKTFSNVFRHSVVTSLIDNVDDAILNNTTNVTLAKFLVPQKNVSIAYNIYYNNAFYHPHSGHDESGGGIITSTGFYVDGGANEMFFNDDGAGNLRRYYLEGIIKNYDDATAGTIDYTTGTIIVKSINITSISNVDGLVSTKIRITAIPNSKDTAPILNQILEIDMVNTSIDGEIDTIVVAAGGTSNYTTYSSTPTTTLSY